MSKTALITGITGQDGAYLAQFLLQKGYRVFGAHRRSASTNTTRLEELNILSDIELLPMDMLEFSNILRVVERAQPDEVYNLAAQSFVGVSFEQPLYTADVDAIGVTRLLEALRTFNDRISFYQASTSEMYGLVKEAPQRETTPFHPRSPYGVAKLYAHWMTVNYREAYGMHTSSGILYNHESPLRGREFVTRKITSTLAKIRQEGAGTLSLGNLEARRDWGYAGDYVQGMWMMLQQPEPGDYVLATNETHSVREFVSQAAEVAGFKLAWHGEGVDEQGIDANSGDTIVDVDPRYFRPAEVDALLGDPCKAQETLGWAPTVSFPELVTMMMEADLKRAARQE